MKVCYVDESGNAAQDPCLVMVGILVDSLRLHRTQKEFAEVFDIVQGLFAENLRELKGSKMILGRDRWRKVDPDKRKQIASYFCDWIGRRKHRLIVTAIDSAKLKELDRDEEPVEVRGANPGSARLTLSWIAGESPVKGRTNEPPLP